MEYFLDKKKIKYICIIYLNILFYYEGFVVKFDYFKVIIV